MSSCSGYTLYFQASSSKACLELRQLLRMLGFARFVLSEKSSATW